MFLQHSLKKIVFLCVYEHTDSHNKNFKKNKIL